MNEKALLSYLTTTNDFIWTYLVIALLLGVGVYFTYRSRFLQVRMLKEMLRVLKEGRKEKRESHRSKHLPSVWQHVSEQGISQGLPSLLRSVDLVQSSGCGSSRLSVLPQALLKVH